MGCQSIFCQVTFCHLLTVDVTCLHKLDETLYDITKSYITGKLNILHMKSTLLRQKRQPFPNRQSCLTQDY